MGGASGFSKNHHQQQAAVQSTEAAWNFGIATPGLVAGRLISLRVSCGGVDFGRLKIGFEAQAEAASGEASG